MQQNFKLYTVNRCLTKITLLLVGSMSGTFNFQWTRHFQPQFLIFNIFLMTPLGEVFVHVILGTARSNIIYKESDAWRNSALGQVKMYTYITPFSLYVEYIVLSTASSGHPTPRESLTDEWWLCFREVCGLVLADSHESVMSTFSLTNCRSLVSINNVVSYGITSHWF